MPRIPVYTAGGQLQGGPLSPDASPLAFNTTAGLGAVAQGLESVGDVAGRIADKKTRDIATTWSNDKINQYRQDAERFLQDPTNENNVHIAFDLEQWSQAKLKELAKDAPNKDAERLFRLQSSDVYTSKLSSALSQGNRAMLSVADKASKEAVQSIVSNNKMATIRDPAEAARGLEYDYKRQLDWIESTYGQAAPTIAARLRAETAQNVAVGVADQNPAFARKIVEESKDLEETTKQSIYAKIEASTVARNRVAEIGFEERMDNELAVAQIAMEPTQMPSHEEFVAIYGKERAGVAEAKYGLEYKATNDAATWYAKHADKNAAYQEKKLLELVKSSPTGHRSVALLRQRVARSEQQQANDLGGWLYENNAEVRQLMEASRAAVDPFDIEDYRDAAMDVMLKYQGPPPQGASEEEAAKYFNVPTGFRAVLSDAEARQWIQRFDTSAPPQQKSAALMEFYQVYGRHADQAWRNLETMPGDGSVPMELQVANIIDSDAVRAHVIGAISNPKVISSLDDKKRGVYAGYVTSNDQLLSFMQMKLGGNFQGSKEAAAIQSMVMTYAEALSLEDGASPKASVQKAIKKIIGENIHMVSIIGSPVAIPVRNGNTWRTEDDAVLIRDAASGLIANFPVGDVNWSLTGVPSQFTDSDRRSLLRTNGRIVTEPNGQAVSVYLSIGSGSPVQLTKKNGEAFIWKFDDLLALGRENIKQQESGSRNTILYNRQP